MFIVHIVIELSGSRYPRHCTPLCRSRLLVPSRRAWGGTTRRKTAPRARALVLGHGWNTTAYQILNPGIVHWFAARDDAVVGYVDRAGVWVVAGAPVCARERLAEIVAEFEADAKRHGRSVCYFGAEGRLETVLAGKASHAFVLLGAQPVWDPADWARRTESRSSVRAQLNRARHKGVVIREIDPADAARDPSLRRCLQAWLDTRGLPPLHFLVEPQTFGNLADRRVFVAHRSSAAVGFLVASLIPARDGWLIEQFVRTPEAPNGTVELLIDTAVRALADAGARYVTMGLAPLSDRATPLAWVHTPAWLRVMLGWLRAHGRRFYNFRGLEAFKAKFDPAGWEPVFAIMNSPRVTPRAFYAITAAFTGGSPASAFARAIVRAVRTEVGWARGARQKAE